jgi:5-methyltetrahydrofolate--homocysteine methyltransferase
MERTEGSAKGSIVLATVKGDVHHNGKNLVDIMLTNNGYTVYNLGIKQPINTIIEAWQAKKADAIGLSGLLVKSTLVMRDDLLVLNERGLTPPVILGGAALTRKYVEKDLSPLYRGPLMYAKDAFEGLDLVRKIVAGEPIEGVRRETSDVRYEERAPAGQPSAAPHLTAHIAQRTERSPDIAPDVSIPTPPFWGSRVVEKIPLRGALGYLNEVMLFQVQWQFKKKGRPQEEFDRYIDTEVRPILRDLVGKCEAEGILQPRAVYGYWPCQSEGNDLVIYNPDDRSQELTRFSFPRQRQSPHWCLADFWRPSSTGEYDVIAMSLVTVGQQASDIARQWFAQDRYRDYLYLHGLGVETAEALAEYIHKQIRMELGIADHDAREVRKLFQQGYQGSRFSFGYPACPNLEDQTRMWPLLRPDRIGVTLSEEFQLEPEQSTSAIIAHHPQARYFKA